MDARYAIADTSQIISPGLVLFKELIAANLRRLLEIAGGPERLRPHVKTHKMREIVAMQLAAGITKHKCATIAEAEMLAASGARDVLIAYQLVGPNQKRLAQLIEKFPACEFSVIADDPAPTRAMSEVMAAAGLEVAVMLDVDVGQHRTGIPVGGDALALYELFARLPGLRPGGLHVYDGHNHHENAAEREAAVKGQFAEVTRFKADLEQRGLEVPRMVCGGTPTFPIYAKIADVECSPGTCVLHDYGYGTRFPDLKFDRAALLLTRVVSRTAPDRMCLDLGYKAVASDPKGDRLILPDLPDARLVLQNEEHLLVETPQAARFHPGDELLACPTHICPTCALHKEAYVVEGGRVAARWQVAARDRWLEV
jgi:D-serine deaminase-like pyridoxal phosphate-dependent protein